MNRNSLFAIILLFGCCTSNKQISSNLSSSTDSKNNETKISEDSLIDFTTPPFVIIYKTKKDYYDNVPVTLNDEKTAIVSYPSVKDIFFNGKLALPEKLHDKYLLDKRGINRNVAFLNITYEDYSKLSSIPSLNEMMQMIIDKDPLIEMYNCGSRYQYKFPVIDLNRVIDRKQVNKFKIIL